MIIPATAHRRTGPHRPADFATLGLLTALLVSVVLAATPLQAPPYFPDVVQACMVVEPPYVIHDPTNTTHPYHGIAITYLEELTSALSFPVQHHLWNSSWSLFIDVMNNCTLPPRPSQNNNRLGGPCPCHLGVGAFTRTNDRVGRVSFVWPHGNEALRMVARKADLRVDKASSTWILFGTFSKRVWILIAFGIALHAFGTIFFHPFLHRHEDLQPSVGADGLARLFAFVRIAPVAVLVSYAHLLQHPFHDPGHRRISFHRSLWLLLGLTAGFFLLTVFAASLTVLLFENEKPSAFRSISDVTDCNIDQSRVAMLSGGASQGFWDRYVNNDDTRRICDWDKPSQTVSSVDEGFDVVLNKSNNIDFFFTAQGSILYHANQRCNDLVPVGEPFVFSSVSFVLPLNIDPKIQKDLDRETRLLRERDAYPSAMMIAAREACDRSRDATITFVQLRIFFILYIVVWALLVAFRIGFLYRRRRLGRDNVPVRTL